MYEWIDSTSYSEGPKLPWKQWFAWYPVKVHAKWVWMEKVYRRPWPQIIVSPTNGKYQYGTVFDVLQDN